MSEEADLTIFRVVQECLTNIHRHSGSTAAAIRLYREDGKLVVEVLDRGRGIPKQKQQALTEMGRSGIGFGGMRERLRQLGGTLEIRSDENGTVVRAILTVGS
jgi:two-component system, NarL family, sensor kinase